MDNKEFDFVDYILFYDCLYDNGVIFSKDTFKFNDGYTVPIVHSHHYSDGCSDLTEYLGIAVLEDRGNGIVAKCKFANHDMGQIYKDIFKNTNEYGLGFWAVGIERDGKNVVSGTIRAALAIPVTAVPRCVAR